MEITRAKVCKMTQSPLVFWCCFFVAVLFSFSGFLCGVPAVVGNNHYSLHLCALFYSCWSVRSLQAHICYSQYIPPAKMSKEGELVEYGALDQLNCLWYIPPGIKFVWARRDIDGVTDIEIGVKGQERGDIVSHGGGTVFFLKEDSSESSDDVPAHWPFVFIAPSLVTLSPRDIKELKVDNDDAPAQSADWPKVADMLLCPVCRKRAEADEKTNYVLTGTQGLRMSKSSQFAAKLLWRIFCLDCFDSLGAQNLYIPMTGFTLADMPSSVIPFLQQGVAAPFDSMGFHITPGNLFTPPGGIAVPSYDRVSSFIKSGFHYCLSSDYNRYLTLMLGGNKSKTGAAVSGQTPSFSSKCKIEIERS